MNESTGAIADFESTKDAKRAGYGIPLTNEEATALKEKDRPERLAWLWQQQKRDPQRFAPQTKFKQRRRQIR